MFVPHLTFSTPCSASTERFVSSTSTSFPPHPSEAKMCGIFGYYNFQVGRERKAIIDILINGLRRLEYRGYDSAGICIDGVVDAAYNGINGKANGEQL